jgi:hypothetical protein
MLNFARIEEERMPSDNELVATIELWIAANDAKAERIRELEAECDRLRGRVARLGRLAKEEPNRRRAASS